MAVAAQARPGRQFHAMGIAPEGRADRGGGKHPGRIGHGGLGLGGVGQKAGNLT